MTQTAVQDFYHNVIEFTIKAELNGKPVKVDPDTVTDEHRVTVEGDFYQEERVIA